jgi:hypothetical protein
MNAEDLAQWERFVKAHPTAPEKYCGLKIYQKTEKIAPFTGRILCSYKYQLIRHFRGLWTDHVDEFMGYYENKS